MMTAGTAAMRVVIPTWTVDAEKGGIRTFLVNLVDGLRRRPHVELTLLCHARSRPLFEPFAGDVRLLDLSPPGGDQVRPVAEQLFAPRITAALGDVLLTPSNVGLLGARIPQVVVVQAPLAVPSIRASHRDVPVDRPHRAYHRVVLGPSLRRAEAVVAVTEWLRGELLRSVPGLDPARVHVVPEGVDPVTVVPANDRLGAPPTILFVSTLFPYKGAAPLIDALGRLHAVHPALGWTCRIVGRDPSGGETSRGLRARATELGVASRVAIVGAVPHADIGREYAAAELFVYPSQLESFGLPPLEAMAAGVPVITSDAPSVREVVDDGARVVDVTDPDQFAAAIAELLMSDEARRDLARAGHRVAARRTWTETAARMDAVLRSVAG
jgi:glycosyltransferase involved in cell wall biosynthesis